MRRPIDERAARGRSAMEGGDERSGVKRRHPLERQLSQLMRAQTIISARRQSHTARGVLMSYLVSNAVVLPMSGWLAGLFGRKRFFLFCIFLFTVSSLLRGTAPTLGLLIIFRVLQGVGGGGLQPMAQAILADVFPPEKRGLAFALYGITAIMAPTIGPTFGNGQPSQVAAHEEGGNAGIRGDPVGDRGAACFVTAGDDNSRRAGRSESPRDRRAEALRRAGDHADFTIHPVHDTTSYPASAITRISSAWPFLAMSSGGLTFGSCSASTTNHPS